MNPKLTAASLRDIAGQADRARETAERIIVHCSDDTARSELGEVADQLQELSRSALRVAKRLDGR